VKKMLVKDYMTKDVVLLTASDSVARARKLMEERGVRSIPVVDRDKKLVGIVTQRDIYAAGLSRLSDNYERGTRALESHLPISEVYCTEVTSIAPDTTLLKAALLLKELKVGALPVLDNDEVVGILSSTDMLAVLTLLLTQ
jgi:CBS domain-containing protein